MELDIDTADYDGTPDRNVTLDGAANDGAAGENDNVQTENITTALGNDTLTGDAGNNRLSGDQGNDTMNGGAGGDHLPRRPRDRHGRLLGRGWPL